MPKYTVVELRAMAQHWVIDNTAGGEKSFRVVIMLGMRTGLAADDIIARIEALAEGIDCYV